MLFSQDTPPCSTIQTPREPQGNPRYVYSHSQHCHCDPVHQRCGPKTLSGNFGPQGRLLIHTHLLANGFSQIVNVSFQYLLDLLIYKLEVLWGKTQTSIITEQTFPPLYVSTMRWQPVEQIDWGSSLRMLNSSWLLLHMYTHMHPHTHTRT